MRRRKLIQRLLAVGLLATVAVTTGCAQSNPKPVPPPAESQLVVSPNGIRDLMIGRPITSYELVNYGEHACPAKGGWLPRYPQDEENSGGQEIDPFDVVTRSGSQSGQITAVYVWSRKIATSKGIRVGSSLAAVISAYPRATTLKAVASELYVVDGSRGKLVIEVTGGNDNPYATGEWPQNWLNRVVWMDVIAYNAKPESLANSNDAGPCPVKGHVPDVDDD
ncbi:MAG TPA: hypothetical protein VHZ81_10785 [Galbitalea sp.]|nr:hypothetical protein [Galbitalea sp.]